LESAKIEEKKKPSAFRGEGSAVGPLLAPRALPLAPRALLLPRALPLPLRSGRCWLRGSAVAAFQ
jgi:hypothetical protein